jgi:methylmalonyl-CoA mutase
VEQLHITSKVKAEKALLKIQQVAIENGNLFDTIMEASKVCSLGQMTQAMFEVGGQYRRNM